MTTRNQPPVILLCLGLIWGSGYALARYCVTNGIPPLGYSFWQAIGPAILLYIICIASGRKWQFSSTNIRFFLICGVFGIAIPNANMYFSAQHLPAGLLAVVVNTTPAFTVLVAWISREDKPRMYQLFGVLTCIAGLLILSLPNLHWQQGANNSWLFTTLITPLCFAIIATYSSRSRPKNLDSLQLASGMLLAASFVLTPVVLATKNFYAIKLTALSLPDAALILEIMLSAIGYILLFKLIAKAGAIYYSLVGGVVACTGLFWGYIIFHEKLTTSTAVAVTAIIVGITLCTTHLKRGSHASNN
jgi:drug/metabolite transporter (DMT)-like permease